MFRFDTFREQMLIVVLFFGVAFIIYLILFLIDDSMPRKKKPGEEGGYEVNYLSWYKAIPWSIWVTAISIIFFMLIYLIVHLIYPISI